MLRIGSTWMDVDRWLDLYYTGQLPAPSELEVEGEDVEQFLDQLEDSKGG